MLLTHLLMRKLRLLSNSPKVTHIVLSQGCRLISLLSDLYPCPLLGAGGQLVNIINPALLLPLHVGSLLAKTDPETFPQSY